MRRTGFHLAVDNIQTTYGIKEAFNGMFPFLRIEFYKEPHVGGNGHLKNKMITSDVKLSEIQMKKKKGVINLNQETLVGDLEQIFKDEFGLYIEIFRRSGNVWLETSATDNWSLQRQNEEGRMLEQDFKNERENPYGRKYKD